MFEFRRPLTENCHIITKVLKRAVELGYRSEQVRCRVQCHKRPKPNEAVFETPFPERWVDEDLTGRIVRYPIPRTMIDVASSTQMRRKEQQGYAPPLRTILDGYTTPWERDPAVMDLFEAYGIEVIRWQVLEDRPIWEMVLGSAEQAVLYRMFIEPEMVSE